VRSCGRPVSKLLGGSSKGLQCSVIQYFSSLSAICIRPCHSFPRFRLFPMCLGWQLVRGVCGMIPYATTLSNSVARKRGAYVLVEGGRGHEHLVVNRARDHFVLGLSTCTLHSLNLTRSMNLSSCFCLPVQFPMPFWYRP